MKILILDTETNSKLLDWRRPPAFHNRYPFIIDIAWRLCDENGFIRTEGNFLIKPEGFSIPKEGFWRDHGYSTEQSLKEGHSLQYVLQLFQRDLMESDMQVAHNILFDKKILQANYHRFHTGKLLPFSNPFCTMQAARKLIDTRDKNDRKKAPRLEELYMFLFGEEMEVKHRAAADVQALYHAFFCMLIRGHIKLNPLVNA